MSWVYAHPTLSICGTVFVLTLILCLIWPGSPSSSNNQTTNQPSSPQPTPQQLHAKIEQLVSLSCYHLSAVAKHSLRRPNLEVIQGEYARARAEYWDYGLPTISKIYLGNCWQHKISTGQGWREFILTPAGDWALLGVHRGSMIRNGEMHEIDSIARLLESLRPANELTLEALEAIQVSLEALLQKYCPSAMPEFYKLAQS